ncbi:hypothetical protein GCM10010336_62300 [Streptomyces goshikiensis]|nr:hypothetical protein GCM10010336_62300 [Streptomyces goshikiensis]
MDPPFAIKAHDGRFPEMWGGQGRQAPAQGPGTAERGHPHHPPVTFGDHTGARGLPPDQAGLPLEPVTPAPESPQSPGNRVDHGLGLV